MQQNGTYLNGRLYNNASDVSGTAAITLDGGRGLGAALTAADILRVRNYGGAGNFKVGFDGKSTFYSTFTNAAGAATVTIDSQNAVGNSAAGDGRGMLAFKSGGTYCGSFGMASSLFTMFGADGLGLHAGYYGANGTLNMSIDGMTIDPRLWSAGSRDVTSNATLLIRPKLTDGTAVLNASLVRVDSFSTTGVFDIGPTGAATHRVDSSATATVTPVLTLKSTSTGTPAAGIGVGLNFEVETAASNVEVGAKTEVFATSTAAAAEVFEWRTTVMSGGTLTNRAYMSLTAYNGHGSIFRISAPNSGAAYMYLGGGDTGGSLTIGTTDSGTTGHVFAGSGKGVIVGSNLAFSWASTTDGVHWGATLDAGLARASAGVVKVTDGSSGYGTLRVGDGTDALPGIAFGNDTDNGLRRITTDEWAAICGGNQVLKFTSSQMLAGVQLSMNGVNLIGDRNQVVAHAADATLNTTSDIGRSYSNTGATGEVILTLPSASVGFNFRFACTAAQYLRIRAPAWEATTVIRNGALVSAASGYIRSNVVGSSLRLECMKTGEWFVTEERGTWTIDS